MKLQYRPKLEKIIELLLYLAHVRPGADKYQAVKLLYLADREHLNRYGRPITFEEYYALDYGPVASKALDLLEGDKYVWRQAKINQLPFKTELGRASNGAETTYMREPLRAVDKNLFSKSDLSVFDEIIERYGECSFGQLFDITHEHFAYSNAWGRRGTANRAPMFYEEMIEDAEKRQAIIEDTADISKYME